MIQAGASHKRQCTPVGRVALPRGTESTPPRISGKVVAGSPTPRGQSVMIMIVMKRAFSQSNS